jgi:aldehyde:ferredoxin oxidoreductase
MELSKEELELLANRITEATREYNRREGITEDADTLSTGFFQQNNEGAFITEGELHTMIEEYNSIRRKRYEKQKA